MKLRTKKQKIAAAVGLSIAALVVLAGIGIGFLRTQAFRNWALRRIVASLEQATGTHAQIQTLNLGLSPLTADFYGITLHGNEPNQSMPLFRAQHIHVALQLLPLLHRQVQVDEVLVEKPELFVQSDAQGRTNLPVPPAAQTSSGFHVALHYAQIRDGSLLFNDFQIPLSADIYGLQANLVSAGPANLYRAELRYDHGRVIAKDFNPLDHALLLQATMGPAQSQIQQLKIVLPHSSLQAQGVLENYQLPQFKGTYQANISGAELGFLLKNTSIPSGEMAMQGHLQYSPSSSESTFLQAASTDGTFESAVLTLRQSDTLIPVRKLQGRFSLQKGQLRLSAIDGDVLGGRLSSTSDVLDLNRNSGTLQAQLTNISLLEARQSSTSAKRLPRLASKANLRLAANWYNGPAHSLIAVNASFSSQNVKRLPDDIPLDGAADLSYDVATAQATIRTLALRTGATQLSASGTLAKKSQINVRFSTTSLHELIAIASQNGAADQIQRSKLDDLQGAATFDGKISGTVRSPDVQGLLTASQVSLQGSQWQSLQANLQLDPSLLQLSNGLLQGPQGRIQISGALPLVNWTPNSSAPFSLDLQTQKLSLASMQHLAHTDYPIQGFLNAQFHASGSISQPKGSGRVDLANATVYGEALSTLNATLRLDPQTIHVNAQAQSPAGALKADLAYEPKSRHYDLEAHLQNLTPSKLSIPQTEVSSVGGTLSADVSGAGTLDDPQLQGKLQSASLQIHGETLSNLQAAVTLQNHNAAFEMTTSAIGSQISANGKVALSGDYLTSVKIDTGSINIGPLIQTHLSTAGPAGGDFELHATASGPLKKPQQMHAHLEIPTLHLSGKNVTISNSQPIRLDYAQGLLKVLDASLTGPATNLSLTGSVPLQGTAPMDLTAKGNFDFKILEGWIQDAIAAGQAHLQLRIRGTRANPDVSGALQLANVAFSSDSLPIGLESLDGSASLHGKRIQIDKLSGIAGGGHLDLGGTVDLGTHPVYALTLTARSARVHQNGVRAVLDTDLHLAGGNTPTLDGQVIVHKLSFDQSSDLNGVIAQLSGDNTVAAPSPLEQKIKLNLSVQSEEEVGLASSQLRISGSANLRLVGTVADPVVLGRIALTGGEVFFLGKRFELQSGNIAFANAARTTPIINLDVGTVVEQYNITIHLSGSLDKLKTTYTSDPSLGSADVINLLAFGQTNAESLSRSSATTGTLGAESAVASAVGGQVAGQLQKISGISQLTIDPLAGNSQNPGAQVAIQQRVTGNLLVTFSTDVTSAQTQTVQLKYQVKPNVTISVLRDENGGYGLDIRFHKAF